MTSIWSIFLVGKPVDTIINPRTHFTNLKVLNLRKSNRIMKFYFILFYHFKKSLCQLYKIILQYIQHPNFYFPILLIKIIFLHNKIIYPKITIIYNTTDYLFFLSHSFCSRTTTNLHRPPWPPTTINTNTTAHK